MSIQRTAGLQSNWIGFDQKCTESTESKPVKLETHCTVILPPVGHHLTKVIFKP